MGEKSVIDSLKPVQIFASLTDQDLLQISAKLRIKQYGKNETILYEEDTNEYMYIILSGKVKVIQISEDGKETILAIHRTGEFFGEMSLIDGKTVPATVLAIENTLTAVISKNDFYSLIHSQSKILERLLQILCARLRNSWDMIQILNFKNASQRLKMLFYMLAEEYGKETGEGVTLDLKLTHRDIANMAGLTRETATRVIDKLQKDKEITILKNRYIRLSPDFMQKDLREGM